ncbi:hypothetical protein [Mycolicibacterium wolinskyi]|uniref:Rv1733c family protein n=1 Tax=Mycolicibacterium wolinskyi TaxID=59750 RepID=UPI0039179743
MNLVTRGLSSWWRRAAGRDALVRRSDRVEAWMAAVTVVALISAALVGSAVGIGLYNARTAHHAAVQSTWHVVTATAMDSSAVAPDSRRFAWSAPACWPALGRTRCDTVDTERAVAAGQRLSIWTDHNGNYVRISDPARRALRDCLVAGLAVWGVLTTTILVAAAICRRRLVAIRSRAVDVALMSLLGPSSDMPDDSR